MLRLLTITELNSFLRELLDAEPILQDLWVEGEVFDFRQAASGHWYFKLRHGDSSLPAACWRSNVARIGQAPRNGEAVLAHGRVGFYEGSGALQLYVDMLRPAGVGLLYAQFERLKLKLEAEGLFEPSRKRALPRLPRRIGVATSPSGAALQDILTALARRYPLTEVLVAPCRVQGDGAAESIVEALYLLYEQDIDLIIVARGGGSMEDLWCFNEEIVARAAFASPVPLVSGVGHETDTTILDFVADLRAATPTAAAELATPTLDDLHAELAERRAELVGSLEASLRQARDGLATQARRLVSHAPLNRLSRDRQAIDDMLRRAAARLNSQIALRHARLDGLRAQVAALSPQATLGRGYAVVRRLRDGQVIGAPEQIANGEAFEVATQGGTFSAERSA